MNRRLVLLGAGVALLAIGNVWRWSAAPADAQRSRARPLDGFTAEDFKLAPAMSQATAAPPPMQRDLFALTRPEPAVAPAALARAVAVPASAVTPAPEQLAQDEARREMGQIKLVGIVFREGRGQAYLVKGDEVFLVSAGDRVASRYQVEQVATDAVELHDPASLVRVRLGVSGE